MWPRAGERRADNLYGGPYRLSPLDPRLGSRNGPERFRRMRLIEFFTDHGRDRYASAKAHRYQLHGVCRLFID